MARLDEIAKIYDHKLTQLRDPQMWESTLRLTSNFWRLPFCAAILLTAQNPHAEMCGTIDQWNRVGRYIKRGEHSVAVFRSRTDTQLMYLFDVKQTYGAPYNAKWKMSDRIADGIVGKYNAEHSEPAVSFDDFLKKELDGRLNTANDYCSEKLNAAISNDPRVLMFIRHSAECICAARCGINGQYDFADAGKFDSDLSIVEIGNAATLLAQDILRDIDGIVRRKEYERYEAGVCGRHLRYPIHREHERAAEPDIQELRQTADDADGTQSGRLAERYRPDSAGYGEHERTVSEHMAGDRGESGSSEGENQPRPAHEISTQRELYEEGVHKGGDRLGSTGSGVGISENERSLAGSGSSQPWDADGDSEDFDEHDEQDLTDEAASDEDAVCVFGGAEEISSESSFCQNLLRNELANSGWALKFRINDFISECNPSKRELAKFLKEEYGIGGGTSNRSPVKWHNHGTKGIELILDDGKLVKYSWITAAEAVRGIVQGGEYITEHDKESRAKAALYEAERFAIHYMFPTCFDNRRLAYIRKELSECGISYEINLDAKMFIPYAAEYVRTKGNVVESFQNTDHSHVNVKATVFNFREAADAARTLVHETGYAEFVETCRGEVSNLISELSEHVGHNPDLGFPDDEVSAFFASNDILSDENAEEISAQVFGYLYSIEQREKSYEKIRSNTASEQLSLFDKAADDELSRSHKDAQDVVDNEPPAAEISLELDSDVKLQRVGNYHFADDFVYPTGPKAKYSANVSAIKTLKRIESEHRYATAEEQDVLAHYSGWGGVADAFDSSKDGWSREYAELKDLLTEKEYVAARESTLTAFYTEPYIVKSIYAALERMGFTGGEILDPAMGTGNFFGNLPEKISANSHIYGVELDDLTARIAKQLYPDSDIQHRGYERTKYENGKFDVIVGNVPFGAYAPYDAEYKDYLIHDYFFAKSIDKLKAGGIMAFITSAGTMDKSDDELRRELYCKADFLGGIRLPEDAFRTAGTQIVTDILFFQKLEHERTLETMPAAEWTDTNRIFGKHCISIENKYFTAHPEMVLGHTEEVSGPYGYTRTVKGDGDTAERLETVVSRINGSFSAEPTIDAELPEEEYSSIPEGVIPYTYYLNSGELFYAENRSAVPFGGKNAARIKGLCGVMAHLDAVTSAQMHFCTDDELAALQKGLDKAYDDFIKKYGYINSQTNTSAFADDIRAPRLAAIENVEELPDGTQHISKADVFTQRTINVERIPKHVDTALEALHLSMNAHQRVDIDFISRLCGKDKDEVIAELGDRIYCNPAKNTGSRYTGWETAEEYLSGHVRTKLALAQEAAKTEPAYERNVTALLQNQPPHIGIEDIGFRLGTIYITPEMYQQFIYETFDTPLYLQHRAGTHGYSRGISIGYSNELNKWKISNGSGQRGVLVTETYGTNRFNAYELTEMLLNQTRATVNDYVERADGSKKKVFNAKETILARECQDKIEQAFHDWVMADNSRIQIIEDSFNSLYNSIKPRTYDGSYISVPGMNPTLSLRPHQKDVIARIAAAGTCMMAHEVGAGKTAAMGAAGMYLKSIGACTKPMYVVPNAVVAQFGEELQRFFPEAKILVATAKDMKKTQRRRFLSKISVGNFDAIVIPQSQFEKMPLSLERQEAMYDDKLTEISHAIQAAKADKGERFTVKALERQRKQIEKKIEKMRADFKKDDFITFEELGCDFLFVDEAHDYKNLAVFSKMNNVAGVNANANSQKAFDMEMKCRYLQELHHGGGVVFATGTPISNSITELFVWQYLLQKQTLDDMNIGYFDNWASVFGVISQSIEVKPSGDGYRPRTRFSNFTNLNELCNLFGEVFDIAKTADMNLKLPSIQGGKPEMLICEKSPEQDLQTDEGIERARRIEAKLVKPDEDNMPAVCTYMTKVALDARILKPDAEEFDGGKVALCADKIIEINRAQPSTAQAVFCDTSTPQKGEFSVYQALKDRLIRSGEFTEKEIAFVHDAANDKQRLEMFEKVNAAEIKVIIGSTSKLGTGVNIQRKLSALHHLDAPYRPSDIEQRNGRGIRQGNENSEVYIGYYSTKGTFDNYRWQILEKKQQIISQIIVRKACSKNLRGY